MKENANPNEEVIELLSESYPELSEFLNENKEALMTYWESPNSDIEQQLTSVLGAENMFAVESMNMEMEAFDSASMALLTGRNPCESAVVEFSIDMLALLIAAFGASVPRSFKRSAKLIKKMIGIYHKIHNLIREFLETSDPRKKAKILLKILLVFKKEKILNVAFEVFVSDMSTVQKAWFFAKIGGLILSGVLTGGGALAVKVGLLIADGIDTIISAKKVQDKCF